MPRQPKKRRSVPLIARDVTPPTLTSLSGNCMLRIGRSEGTTGITGITSLANEQGHCPGGVPQGASRFRGNDEDGEAVSERLEYPAGDAPALTGRGPVPSVIIGK
jgi:hypothetical protein